MSGSSSERTQTGKLHPHRLSRPKTPKGARMRSSSQAPRSPKNLQRTQVTCTQPPTCPELLVIDMAATFSCLTMCLLMSDLKNVSKTSGSTELHTQEDNVCVAFSYIQMNRESHDYVTSHFLLIAKSVDPSFGVPN